MNGGSFLSLADWIIRMVRKNKLHIVNVNKVEEIIVMSSMVKKVQMFTALYSSLLYLRCLKIGTDLGSSDQSVTLCTAV